MPGSRAGQRSASEHPKASREDLWGLPTSLSLEEPDECPELSPGHPSRTSEPPASVSHTASQLQGPPLLTGVWGRATRPWPAPQAQAGEAACRPGRHPAWLCGARTRLGFPTVQTGWTQGCHTPWPSPTATCLEVVATVHSMPSPELPRCPGLYCDPHTTGFQATSNDTDSHKLGYGD